MPTKNLRHAIASNQGHNDLRRLESSWGLGNLSVPNPSSLELSESIFLL